MSLKEIHALQSAGNYNAVGPLLAAYATAYFLRHSLVYRHLASCYDEVRLEGETVFCTSPTRTSTDLSVGVAPLVTFFTNVAFPTNELMSADVYAQVTQSLKEAVDRTFLNLASTLVVHDWPPVNEGVEKFFLHSRTIGQLYVEDTRCALPEGTSYSIRPQGLITDTLYQVHLTMRLALSLGCVTR